MAAVEAPIVMKREEVVRNGIEKVVDDKGEVLKGTVKVTREGDEGASAMDAKARAPHAEKQVEEERGVGEDKESKKNDQENKDGEEEHRVADDEDDDDDEDEDDDADALECNMRFLMVAGANFTFRVAAKTTIAQMKAKIIEERPKEMVDALLKSPGPSNRFPSKTEEIRFLHGGRFLDDGKTLSDYDFPTGEEALTTVHVTIRTAPSVMHDVKGKLSRRKACCCAMQ